MIATIITSMLLSLFVSVIYSILYVKYLNKRMDNFIKKKEYFIRREMEQAYQKELLKARKNNV